MTELESAIHVANYAHYSWGFEAGKVGQHVDTTIAGNKAAVRLKELLALLSDERERSDKLERSVAELLCILRDWEPDNASPKELAAMRRARWVVGEKRLVEQLTGMAKPANGPPLNECDNCGGCGWDIEYGIEEQWKTNCRKCNIGGTIEWWNE